jgi:hypothetical protein
MPPALDFRCIILKPLRYIETTVRFKVGPLLSPVTNDVASKLLGPRMTFGIIDNELLASLRMVTGSPAFSFNWFTHFFGSDRTYVDLPVY